MYKRQVLLLPEEAGGHYATKEILVRLGYSVIDMAADPVSLCVDMEETKKIMKQYEPQLIFVDRSEGIYYEDVYKRQVPPLFTIQHRP